jgi:uncharacterized membrane protein YidH (DUF202 family)
MERSERSKLRLTESSPPDALPEEEIVSAEQTVDYAQVSALLSNERTFIAWSGIGVLLIVAGVVIAGLSHALDTNPVINIGAVVVQQPINSTSVGLSFLVAGILLIICASYRFLKIQKQIREGVYRASSFLALIFLFIILLLTAVLALHLLEVRRTLYSVAISPLQSFPGQTNLAWLSACLKE